MSFTFATFTKPFTKESPEELGKLFAGLGLDGMEFCLRDGYQVIPGEAEKKLPLFVEQMKNYGIKVIGVAGPLEEAVFAGCRAAGIPHIRTLINLNLKLGFIGAVDEARKNLDPMVRLAEKYGVTIGIQNHFGPMINNSMELRYFLEGYPKNLVGAIWDSASSCLAGEEPEQALSMIADRLVMVNLKNAYYVRSSTYDNPDGKYDRVICSGRQGMARWPEIFSCLSASGYCGPMCLAHEYTDQNRLLDLLKEDLAYAGSL
ncbi:MAG: sugar phosphate isomerase/epimerase [Treponema sp.]|jgi:sugar phosphate isomerase/epimerase|nr:sugar phosphate isomerase/epimerase [Treponema sp.]